MGSFIFTRAVAVRWLHDAVQPAFTLDPFTCCRPVRHTYPHLPTYARACCCNIRSSLVALQVLQLPGTCSGSGAWECARFHYLYACHHPPRLLPVAGGGGSPHRFRAGTHCCYTHTHAQRFLAGTAHPPLPAIYCLHRGILRPRWTRGRGTDCRLRIYAHTPARCLNISTLQPSAVPSLCHAYPLMYAHVFACRALRAFRLTATTHYS